jgi:hypothetical protein
MNVTQFSLIAVAASCVAFDSHAQTSIESFCRAEWPTDFRMREYCINKQTDGAREIVQFTRDYDLTMDGAALREKVSANDAAATILLMCVSEWPSDWSQMAYCVRQQKDAALRLGDLRPPTDKIQPLVDGIMAISRWRRENPDRADVYAQCEERATAEMDRTGAARVPAIKQCLDLSDSSQQ